MDNFQQYIHSRLYQAHYIFNVDLIGGV